MRLLREFSVWFVNVLGLTSPSTPMSARTELSDADTKQAGGLLQQASTK